MQPDSNLSRTGLFHLLVVYIVWSSTYLAIRVAVSLGSGFPPFIMSGSRLLTAAAILFLIAYLCKQRIKITKTELVNLAISGTLLWVFGNGLVIWAEQYASSSFAALVVSSSPIWVTLFESVMYRKKPSVTLTIALLTGFLGIGVLMYPALSKGISTEITAGIALVCSAICWSIGSIYQSRNPVNLSSHTASAYQHVAACVGFFFISLLFQEPAPAPTQNAYIAWLYLIVFGSVFAFTSFVSVLKLLPIQIAMTFAYVNPVLALFLGWFILDEPVTSWTIGGAVLVISSVAGIFSDRYKPKMHIAAEC
ncbi:DMT family transporter [Dendrosporobacter sp. 1207_IL3150]|uniref:DMT family transporter n=1 Tax=Dendrosporobacter sp. 1207_IL3150 TaxID=3084054 RepID=UPI002FDAB441